MEAPAGVWIELALHDCSNGHQSRLLLSLHIRILSYPPSVGFVTARPGLSSKATSVKNDMDKVIHS